MIKFLTRYHTSMWLIHVTTFLLFALISGVESGAHAKPPSWIIIWSLIIVPHTLVHLSLTVRDRINDKLND